MIGIDRLFQAGRICKGSSAGITLFVLASCSGGGGSGNLQSNPNAGFLDQIEEPSAPATAEDWSESREYGNSTGLAQVKAAEGYARRSGGQPAGQGVRIAIIDGGIDVSHPDLGNIADTSWSAGDEELVADDHATFVAGIAGASRTQSSDPNDMHGIAYRATLVNFQAARPSDTEANGFVSFGTDDLVDAIGMASGVSSGSSAVESDILNLSLGAASDSDSTYSKLRNAMRAAADEEKIMVLAAGNDGDDQPIYPAAYADDSGIAGYAIVVGNLTASDEAASTSNRCGDTMDYCLFAPGTSIQSTLSEGTYGIGSGTSFAAPYVAGAAAVVKAAFPGVSSQDVVDRLLLTAADLGPAGVDSTYGHGRLDLEAAMAPVGPTGFPTGRSVDGPRRLVQPSAFRLGQGMVMEPAAKDLLGRAMAVDSMGFPFPVDLAEGVSEARRSTGLPSFISDEDLERAAADHGHATLAAFVPEADIARSDDGFSATSLASNADGSRKTPLRFDAALTESTWIFASLDSSAGSSLGLSAGLNNRHAVMLQTESWLQPFTDLATASSGGGMRFSPLQGTDIAISAFASSAGSDAPQQALQQVEIKQDVLEGTELRIGLGLLQEEGGIAGGSMTGAFGDDSSAQSRFLTLSLLGRLTDNIVWFTTYSRGRASIGADDDAFIGNWSNAQSEAFGTGLVFHHLFKDDDGLMLSIGQPLRQEDAEATIDLPVARNPDGSVVRTKERVDFAPKAREIATELGYSLPLDQRGDHDIRAAGFLRINPDHDENRDPDVGFGLGYRWRF